MLNLPLFQLKSVYIIYMDQKNDYIKKYLKYKNKYLSTIKDVPQSGAYFPEYDQLAMMNGKINEVKADANRAAYELLNLLSDMATGKDIWHQIATAESLTGGLIFSTLVDIPFAGWAKYGCFGVYDTDAKRIMLGVSVEDVYTHLCVKQMAIGILKNTNATIAIAVSGNAMATPQHKQQIGEVFIGIAGYKNNEIILSTQVYNFCEDIEKTCGQWFHDNKYKMQLVKHFTSQDTNGISETGKNLGIQQRQIYAPSQLTEMIASYVRNKTTQEAFVLCKQFVIQNNLDIPVFINNDKIKSNTTIRLELSNINQNVNRLLEKSDRKNYPVICTNGDICNSASRNDANDKKEFTKDLIS